MTSRQLIDVVVIEHENQWPRVKQHLSFVQPWVDYCMLVIKYNASHHTPSWLSAMKDWVVYTFLNEEEMNRIQCLLKNNTPPTPTIHAQIVHCLIQKLVHNHHGVTYAQSNDVVLCVSNVNTWLSPSMLDRLTQESPRTIYPPYSTSCFAHHIMNDNFKLNKIDMDARISKEQMMQEKINKIKTISPPPKPKNAFEFWMQSLESVSNNDDDDDGDGNGLKNVHLLDDLHAQSTITDKQSCVPMSGHDESSWSSKAITYSHLDPFHVQKFEAMALEDDERYTQHMLCYQQWLLDQSCSHGHQASTIIDHFSSSSALKQLNISDSKGPLDLFSAQDCQITPCLHYCLLKSQSSTKVTWIYKCTSLNDMIWKTISPCYSNMTVKPWIIDSHIDTCLQQEEQVQHHQQQEKQHPTLVKDVVGHEHTRIDIHEPILVISDEWMDGCIQNDHEPSMDVLCSFSKHASIKQYERMQTMMFNQTQPTITSTPLVQKEKIHMFYIKPKYNLMRQHQARLFQDSQQQYMVANAHERAFENQLYLNVASNMVVMELRIQTCMTSSVTDLGSCTQLIDTIIKDKSFHTLITMASLKSQNKHHSIEYIKKDNHAQVDDNNVRVDDDHASMDHTNVHVDDNNVLVDDDHASIDDTNVHVDDDHAHLDGLSSIASLLPNTCSWNCLVVSRFHFNLELLLTWILDHQSHLKLIIIDKLLCALDTTSFLSTLKSRLIHQDDHQWLCLVDDTDTLVMISTQQLPFKLPTSSNIHCSWGRLGLFGKRGFLHDNHLNQYETSDASLPMIHLPHYVALKHDHDDGVVHTDENIYTLCAHAPSRVEIEIKPTSTITQFGLQCCVSNDIQLDVLNELKFYCNGKLLKTITLGDHQMIHIDHASQALLPKRRYILSCESTSSAWAHANWIIYPMQLESTMSTR